MNPSESYRTFRMATWLGWQVESNWTDPFLFAVYVIFKPLATAAILVMMLYITTRMAAVITSRHSSHTFTLATRSTSMSAR